MNDSRQGKRNETPPQAAFLQHILSEHQTEPSATALFGLLDDTSKQVRRAAIDALSEFPREMLADGIAECLKSRRKHRREAAQELVERQ